MDSNDVEDDLVKIGFDRVQREVDDEPETDDGEDDEPEADEGEDDNESDGESISTNRKEVWYEKVTFLINHIRDVSLDLIYVLGTIMSLDEMTICVFGRSNETHYMKNKPIKEGYDFFVLATKNGFIMNFTPDGQRAAHA
eukprot:9791303-Ditylum_brightwellii.AAC.1